MQLLRYNAINKGYSCFDWLNELATSTKESKAIVSQGAYSQNFPIYVHTKALRIVDMKFARISFLRFSEKYTG
jgi:hypothetical protein